MDEGQLIALLGFSWGPTGSGSIYWLIMGMEYAMLVMQ